jgi:hypothetical protein
MTKPQLSGLLPLEYIDYTVRQILREMFCAKLI